MKKVFYKTDRSKQVVVLNIERLKNVIKDANDISPTDASDICAYLTQYQEMIESELNYESIYQKIK